MPDKPFFDDHSRIVGLQSHIALDSQRSGVLLLSLFWKADFRWRQKQCGKCGGFSCQRWIFFLQGLPNIVDFLLVCESLF